MLPVAEAPVAHISLVPAAGLQELGRSSKGKNSTDVIFPTLQDPTILHPTQAPNPHHHGLLHELDLAS